MDPFRVIVVGTDLTPASRAALDEAVRIAAWSGAEVRAVHVIDEQVAERLEEVLREQHADARGELVADARRACTEWVAGTTRTVKLSCEVRVDHPVRGILAGTRDARSDLLVLGARGASAANLGVGTVATACVRHAMVPVLVVRDVRAGPFRKIVACVDFSATSRAALVAAARFARHDAAQLHVLHVFDAPWHELHYRAPTLEADPRFQQQYRDGLDRRLRAFTRECGPDVESLHPTFAVFDHQGHRAGIVSYAESAGADLIVLGTRGNARIRAWILGRTAEKVLRESQCSVLAVKPEGFHDDLTAGDDEPRPPVRVDI